MAMMSMNGILDVHIVVSMVNYTVNLLKNSLFPISCHNYDGHNPHVIDKLYTTEVIRYVRGGYAIDTEAKPRCLCITTECVSDNLSSVWFIWLVATTAIPIFAD